MATLKNSLQRPLTVMLGFVALLFVLEVSGLKFDIAATFFKLEGEQWSLRNHFITKTILHESVRWLNIVAVLGLLMVIVYQYIGRPFATDKHRYALLLISVLFSFGLVNYFKYILGMDCPWDLQQFGGSQPYVPLWQFRPEDQAAGRCFPAGHSSIGFAWIALYFFWRQRHPVRARRAFVTALIIGFILGLSQQLRGAHFFIDDVTTAFICWCIPAIIFHIGDAHASVQR
ncbi:phosphatase PAP2 family protein [Pseudidiomarina aestuarii]|nr:phosphatase PAP2 family protein [Pseudidiomarina aestuarii]